MEEGEGNSTDSLTGCSIDSDGIFETSQLSDESDITTISIYGPLAQTRRGEAEITE